MTITPDTKDWTWVLEQACPECGYDATAVAPTEVAGLLRANLGDWSDILAKPNLAVRPSPEVWSPLEYGCHVRDVLRLFHTRLQLMLADSGVRFENWDQDQTALEDRYDLADPAMVSKELADAGETLAAAFAAVEGEQWSHRGVRSDGAEFTVATFSRYFLHDVVHHVADVRGR